MTLNIALPMASLFLFALSSAFTLISFRRPQQNRLYQLLALYVFLAGTVVITSSILTLRADHLQLFIVTVAWVGVGAVYIFNVRAIVSFLAPLMTVILLLHWLLLPKILPVPHTVEEIILTLHVWLAIGGQAFAISACALSVLYLWQRHVLKNKIIKWVMVETTALERIGSALTVCLWIGFALLTVSLLTGLFYSRAYLQDWLTILQLKIIWALLVWCWYFATLLYKYLFNSSHRNIACMSLGGFVLLAASFFGLLFFNQQQGI